MKRKKKPFWLPKKTIDKAVELYKQGKLSENGKWILKMAIMANSTTKKIAVRGFLEKGEHLKALKLFINK